MRERPILFNAEMVRAVLDGKKTQTRRVVKPSRHQKHYSDIKHGHSTPSEYNNMAKIAVDLKQAIDLDCCPYGKVGDQLWVRETFAIPQVYNAMSAIEAQNVCPSPLSVLYRCDGENPNLSYLRWRPSIHMPRWASRIQLEITNIRVERVQDINGSDALSEGVAYYDPEKRTAQWKDYLKDGEMVFTPQASFRSLWDSINAKRGYGWDKNPWVWVVEFKVI